MKKVVIVSTALTMGGVERASSTIANQLSTMGYQVVFISILCRPHFFALNPDIKFVEPKGFNATKISFFKTIRWLRMELVKEDAGVVFSFTKFYSALVSLALIGTSKRLVISERSSPLYKWPWKIEMVCRIAFLLRKPQGIVSQTTIAREIQGKKYGRKVPSLLLPNPLRAVKVYPELTREKVVLAVGRDNDASKGFDLLLEVVKRLKNKDWEVWIAGVDEQSSLKKMAIELSVDSRILFLGKVGDIDALYAKAGIFVIPSRSEGFPNALCEAMAAGLPCVSFDFVAGPRDIIKDGYNGLIIQSFDCEAMANKIDWLIENKNERDIMASNATEVKERYKPAVLLEKLANFLFNESR